MSLGSFTIGEPALAQPAQSAAMKKSPPPARIMTAAADRSATPEAR